MALIHIRLVMEMLPAIKFGVYVQLNSIIGAAIAGIMLDRGVALVISRSREAAHEKRTKTTKPSCHGRRWSG